MTDLKGTSALFLLLVCTGPTATAQFPGAFTTTGSMITPRFSHTATLLPNGKVLIAGGNTDVFIGEPFHAVSTAEIYDPATGTFTSTGMMSQADFHTGGVLLADGRVLFTSFFNSSAGALAAIEIYDPSTEIFSIAGTAATISFVSTVTLLQNGQVLLTGYGSNTAYGTEIYDPIAGTSTPFPNSLRDAPFAAVALADGRVLLQFYESNALMFDPASESFTDTGGLCCFDGPPQATVLLDGKILFSGGNDIAGSEIRAEVYDPASGTWASPMQMDIARDGHSSTLMPDGTALLAGGLPVAGGNNPATSTAEIYTPNAGFSFAGSLATGRASHTATLLNDGRVLISGGSTYSNRTPILGLSSAEIYTPVNPMPAAALLSLPGSSQAAVQHADSYQLVTMDYPAVAGEIIVIYCTGLADGAVISPRLAIGGQTAQVLWFGSIPGYPGLNQVNVRVPAGVPSGPSVPMRMDYMDRPSNTVSIAVE